MRSVILTCLFVVLVSSATQAQNFKTPVEYLDYLGKMDSDLSKNYLDYMSAVAHSNNARKMEKRRGEVLTSIQNSSRDLSRLRPYGGDATLRNAYRDYYKLLYSVFNEDYHKIVDMEEIAEQSYDAMEAYLLAQEKAGEKLAEASEKLGPAVKDFAEANNIRLMEDRSKTTKKMRQVGQVNRYHRTVYLIYFKSFKQDAYVIKSIQENDVSGAVQNKNTMMKYAEEGISKLDTMKAFQGDGSLINTCRKVLNFQLQSAPKVQEQIDMLIKFDEFEKTKKAYDAKPQNKRTQADVDAYNKSVDQYNKLANAFNSLSQELHKGRESAYNGWLGSSKRFMSSHVPQG